MGCCGCGCLALFLIGVLILVLTAATVYWTGNKVYKYTSAHPSEVLVVDAGDEVYRTALAKVSSFNAALDQNRTASLHLTADEINTLLARNETVKKLGLFSHFTLTGDTADVQTTFPLGPYLVGAWKDRHLNSEISFTPQFNSDSRTIHLALKSLVIGDHPLTSEELAQVESNSQTFINNRLQGNPYLRKIIARAKYIGIDQNEFVIEVP